MTGSELKDIAHETFSNELIVFEDKDGNIHEVYGARSVRADGVRYMVLSERYLGFDLRIDKPSQELTDKLNSFNEEYFNRK